MIRRVRWTELPLGSVVLEGPALFHARVPELEGYPLITERLRAELTTRYQLGPRTLVTIADPAAGLEQVDFRGLDRMARRWKAGLPPLADRKREARLGALRRADAREGLASVTRYETTAYTLEKDWARSVSAMVRDPADFGAVLGGGNDQESIGSLVGRLLAGQLPLLPETPIEVDLGVDVSYSMVQSGKADLVLEELTAVLAPVVRALGASTWRTWTFSETLAPADSPRPSPGETDFAPFLRQVLEADRVGVPHLCLLVTDGQCRDRPGALRLLERLRTQGIAYLQLVLHQDEEYRTYIVAEPGQGRDGVYLGPVAEGGPDAPVVNRSDEEWDQACGEVLRGVTDLAEAAHGGQLVLTWNPLFRVVTLDVYERFLGLALRSTPPEAS